MAASPSDGTDFDTAVRDPAGYYAEPEAVVADEEVSRAQKLRFLQEWTRNLAERPASAGPSDSEAEVADRQLMRRINDAIRQLKAMPDEEPKTVRSLWKRLTDRRPQSSGS